MTIIMDGKKLAEKVTGNIKSEIKKYNIRPKLAVIMAGDNPSSKIYVQNKQKKALELGIDSVVLTFPQDVYEDNLLENIYILNEDVNINAILVQLPLPEHINTKRILEAIEPIKDVDGFTSYNFGLLALGYNPYCIPCTPKGILRLFDEYNIELEGKNVLVAGRSNIVGKPMMMLLQNRNATVTLAHSKTKNLKDISINSDIIISAVGKENLITEDMVKQNSIIIDVGINRDINGLKGDVDFKNVINKASYITPVPGGVGPMTIAMLMENTFELYKIQKNYQLL